jgi:flagellar L-ring protein precursor FlgH
MQAPIVTINRTAALALCSLLLAACAGTPRSGTPPVETIDYRPAVPSAAYGTSAEPGTIFGGGSSFDLFMDLRARAVGDILTIALVERTNASKESSTSAAKSAELDTGFPIFAGRPVTSGGTTILNNEISSERSFSGQADASQSNRLDGNITVTVAERLPNGNLLVRGEKWITLNQGEEFIRLQGIVRPVDIGPDNRISSTKVADAKITYSGKGTLADSNRTGWLTRFFNSPWFPF